MDRTRINCYFNLTILDVISIDDNENIFKAKFKIEIEWKDIRLKFRHAKKGMTQKVLFFNGTAIMIGGRAYALAISKIYFCLNTNKTTAIKSWGMGGWGLKYKLNDCH